VAGFGGHLLVDLAMTAPVRCARGCGRAAQAGHGDCIDCAERAWKAGEACCGCSGAIAELSVGSKDEEGYVLCPECAVEPDQCQGCGKEADVEIEFETGRRGWYCARCVEEIVGARTPEIREESGRLVIGL